MNRSSILGLACALALGIGACGGGDEPEEFAQGGTYTEPLTSDPGNLHPLRASNNTTNWVLPFAYDTLISIDGKGRVVSQLAEKWDVTPKRVTFTLRQGITCADGTELTATHVADNFEWIKGPKNKSTMIGEKLPTPDFEVEADDTARTVTVSVPEPYGFLLEGAGTMWIVCPKGLEDPKSLAHATDGTGPFKLTDYVADDHLTFEARKDYAWGPDGAAASAAGTPDKIVFKIVQNESTTANLLLSGQLTSATIAGPDGARLEGQGFQKLEDVSGPSDLFFNQRSGHPGADPKVREALTTALKLDELAKVVTEGGGRRPTSLALLAPQPCRDDNVTGSLPEHDLERAKALLDEAGWTAGANGTRMKDGKPLTVSVAFLSGVTPISAGMELVADWWKEIGVDVKLKGGDANAFSKALFDGNEWDVAYLSVALPFPNMFMAYASGPPSPEGQNFAAIENAEYQRLADEALQTTGDEGCALWGQAEQALFGDLDVVPVAADVVTTYTKGARIAIGLNGTEPTSIRMLAR